jgi:predicted ATP-grasp superfamily ATP-dependent carboligase
VKRPSAILLGGGRNALSVARSLGRRGIEVYAISFPNDPCRYSRYVKWIDVPAAADPETSWGGYLRGPESEWLRGSVLLSTSDAGLLVLSRHRDELSRRFTLDLCAPEAQVKMLYKLSTYELARAAGVPTPKFWVARDVATIDALRDQLVYPLIVKPLLSHVFERAFDQAKYLRAENFDQLREAFRKVDEAGIECMLVEYVPGGDDQLCSYYTYLDEDGRACFDFTKRVIRRYPAGMGLGSCHLTDYNAEVRQAGLKLFRAAGLRGICNAEFKRDPRDGVLKLMEVNGRFTAATSLVTASGIDMGWFIYNRLTGGPAVPVSRYREGVMLWDLHRDFKAYRERRRLEGLTLGRWLGTISIPFIFPVFAWDDPMPTVDFVRGGLRAAWRRLVARLRPHFLRSARA